MLDVFQRKHYFHYLNYYIYIFFIIKNPTPISFIFAYLIIEAGRPAGANSLSSMSSHLYQENVITTKI